MSILLDEATRVVVLGITAGEGTFHAQKMIEYGTRVVAGMTPGKGGAMWQIISKPDLLIYLGASYPVSTARRQLIWQEKDHQEQLRRLAHARQHAHLVIETDRLTSDQILQKALIFLRDISP